MVLLCLFSHSRGSWRFLDFPRSNNQFWCHCVSITTPSDGVSFLPQVFLSPLLESLSSLSKRNDNHTPTVFIDPKLQITSDLSDGILTLDECLRSYFHREVMDFSAEYTCEKCGRVVEVLRDIQMGTSSTDSNSTSHALCFWYLQCCKALWGCWVSH